MKLKLFLLLAVFLFSFGIFSSVLAANVFSSGQISASDCFIQNGSDTCLSFLNWTTSNLNPNVPFEVTKNNPNNTHISFNNSGINIQNTVKYGNTSFYLYYGGNILDSIMINASCLPGSVWGGSKCESSGIAGPSGVISASSCFIQNGSSSCSSSLNWTTSNLNPNVPFEVTKNNPNNTHISFNNLGFNILNLINYGNTSFYLYYGGNILNSTNVNAICLEGSAWNGNKCMPDMCLNLPGAQFSVPSGASINMLTSSAGNCSCPIPLIFDMASNSCIGTSICPNPPVCELGESLNWNTCSCESDINGCLNPPCEPIVCNQTCISPEVLNLNTCTCGLSCLQNSDCPSFPFLCGIDGFCKKIRIPYFIED